jgi:hypothetical protein
MACESDFLSWLVVIMVVGIVLTSMQPPPSQREMLTYELREMTVTIPGITEFDSGAALPNPSTIQYDVTVTVDGTTKAEATFDYTHNNDNSTLGNTYSGVTVSNPTVGVTGSVATNVNNIVLTLQGVPFAEDYAGATSAAGVASTVVATLVRDAAQGGNLASDSATSAEFTIDDVHKGLGDLNPVTGVEIEITPMGP